MHPVTTAVRLSAFTAMFLVANGASFAAERMEERAAGPPTVLRPMTVAQLNRALANAQRMPAELQAGSTARHSELSGRTPADDHAEYYFTEVVRDQVQSML